MAVMHQPVRACVLAEQQGGIQRLAQPEQEAVAAMDQLMRRRMPDLAQPEPGAEEKQQLLPGTQPGRPGNRPGRGRQQRSAARPIATRTRSAAGNSAPSGASPARCGMIWSSSSDSTAMYRNPAQTQAPPAQMPAARSGTGKSDATAKAATGRGDLRDRVDAGMVGPREA
jgi:hypothetical protein